MLSHTCVSGDRTKKILASSPANQMCGSWEDNIFNLHLAIYLEVCPPMSVVEPQHMLTSNQLCFPCCLWLKLNPSLLNSLVNTTLSSSSFFQMELKKALDNRIEWGIVAPNFRQEISWNTKGTMYGNFCIPGIIFLHTDNFTVKKTAYTIMWMYKAGKYACSFRHQFPNTCIIELEAE